MCGDGVIVVLGLDGTLMARRAASVANKRGLRYACTILSLKTGADRITSQAGFTVDVADLNLSTGIRLLTVKTMDAEVVWIDKAATVECIHTPVEHHLLGDGGGILAKVLGDLPEGFTLVKRLLDVLTILQCEMSVVSRY